MNETQILFAKSSGCGDNGYPGDENSEAHSSLLPPTIPRNREDAPNVNRWLPGTRWKELEADL